MKNLAKNYKKIFIVAISIICLALSFNVRTKANADVQTYTLNDNFGAAPLVRTTSENLERTSLSEEHKEYSKYGLAMKLTASSQGREYLTYNLTGVVSAEISAIIRQSDFGANHGWGYSLGVTDNPKDMPLNNVENVNLNNIYPIYLSNDGVPFIYTENKWWCYIAGEKYSFVPSTTDVTNGLREFTVPEEVGGKIAEDGFSILEKGFRTPMINLEYYDDDNDQWVPMILDSRNYLITKVDFLGGEKYYNITVQIKNIPSESSKVRVGVDYIRKTLKPSTENDIEPDIYEKFPISYDEAIYLTNVKFSINQVYNGGFEELEQTGISVIATEAQSFAFGEDFSIEDLQLYDVYNGGINERNFDDTSFTITPEDYDKYCVGIYKVNVSKGEYTTEYYVEVLRPNEIVVDTSKVNLELSKNTQLDLSELKVKARTNIGNVNSPKWKEFEVPTDKFVVDDSAINYKASGKYEVVVTVGEGIDAVSTTFEVNVAKSSGCGSTIESSLIVGMAILTIGIVAIITKKNKKTNV